MNAPDHTFMIEPLRHMIVYLERFQGILMNASIEIERDRFDPFTFAENLINIFYNLDEIDDEYRGPDGESQLAANIYDQMRDGWCERCSDFVSHSHQWRSQNRFRLLAIARWQCEPWLEQLREVIANITIHGTSYPDNQWLH